MAVIHLIIGLGGVAFVFLILFVLTLVFMGSEGRYHLKRGLSKGGVDLLLYNKMANTFTPKTIKYNGKFWESDDHAIFFNMESMKNPANPSEEEYNETISKTPHWQGSRRPVLIATEELFYTFTPDFLAFLNKGQTPHLIDIEKPHIDKNWRYTNTKKITDEHENTQFYKGLLELAQAGYGKLSVISSANIRTVLEHIDGVSSFLIGETFDMGEDSGIQLMTRPKKPVIKTWQIVVGAAAIFALIFLVVIIQQGGLPIGNIMPGQG